MFALFIPALQAYKSISWFHILSLFTCYLTQFVKTSSASSLKSGMTIHKDGAGNLGHARLEVLAIFASSVLAMLASMFVIKEGLERMLDPPDVHT